MLAAPSGAGKSSVASALLARDPRLLLSVSVTTRAPRAGEVDGVHYRFVTRGQFADMAASGALLEHADVFGRGYGSPRAPVEVALGDGRDVLFDIDWQGFRQLRAALPGDVLGVFLMPPSTAELEARLRRRGTDSEAEIQRRMQAAQAEMAHADEFDHVVVNREFGATVEEIGGLLERARARHPSSSRS